jgi:TPP-dependent pyruvate/acetoin dehydrogenase alpha subunit
MAIGSEIKKKMLRQMLRIRVFEETVQELYRAGRIPGSLHLSTGQEAIPVGFCQHLRREDFILSSHRGHGHVLAKGGEYRYMLAELYGRRTGYCKGKGGSMHFACAELGILGAGICLAAGVGFSSRYQSSDTVTVCFFGDGAANTGAFHEGLNFAALRKAQVVFVIENNQYAISVPRGQSDLLEKLSIRAASYGMPGVTVDGNDVMAVYQAAEEAILRARTGGGPSLVECLTYRWHGHHAGEPRDGMLYRTKDEIEAWKERCPIRRLREALSAEGVLQPQEADGWEQEFRRELEEAIAFAESSPYPLVEDLLADAYVGFQVTR